MSIAGCLVPNTSVHLMPQQRPMAPRSSPQARDLRRNSRGFSVALCTIGDTIDPMVLKMHNTNLKPASPAAIAPASAIRIPVFEEAPCCRFVLIGYIVEKRIEEKRAA